jgi:hypothetical protein
MSALSFSRTLRARYLRAGAALVSGVHLARLLRPIAGAAAGDMVFLRIRPVSRPLSLSGGSPGAVLPLVSTVRELVREIHHHEIRTSMMSPPPAPLVTRAVEAPDRGWVSPRPAQALSPAGLLPAVPAAITPPERPARSGPAAPADSRPSLPALGSSAGPFSPVPVLREIPLPFASFLGPARSRGGSGGGEVFARTASVLRADPARGEASSAGPGVLERVRAFVTVRERSVPALTAVPSAAATPAGASAQHVFHTPALPPPPQPAHGTPAAPPAAIASALPAPAGSRPVPLSAAASVPTWTARPRAGLSLVPRLRAPAWPASSTRGAEPLVTRSFRPGPRLDAVSRLGLSGGSDSPQVAFPDGTPPAATPALATRALPALPEVRPRPAAPRVSAPELSYVRPRPRAAAPAKIEETLRRHVDERVERTVVERVEKVVARQLALDSPYSRRLGEQICAGIHEGLVLERERMGWR